MGCGGSKLENDDNVAPLGLRPFRRRIEEIRQRRNGRAINDGTYTKGLLNDEEEDSPNAHYSENSQSVSLPSENEGVGSGKGQSAPIKDATAAKVHHHEESTPGKDGKINKIFPESDKNSKTEVEETERGVEMDNCVGKEDSGSNRGDDNDDDGGGGGDGGYFDWDGAMIAPGSPSFRDYFLSAAINVADRDSSNAGHGEDTSVEVKTQDKPSRRKGNRSSSSEVHCSFRLITIPFTVLAK
ncbi:uncharacterized protein LOC122077392 isoform X2 [Macadamia integrifolia]|uniref:uncharacterized protein LOC122077392 isoform X2 n=1 Tax=Macadamia integrifolia TaxID=60698 RepID=UPI001C4E4973|nr:uncharacterized protein LOC122077392 isoform X2 [Macadamia integrifolia]